MATYLMAYEDELTRRIEAGGDPEKVEAAIQQWNGFHRSFFEQWLNEAKLSCVHCGKPAVMVGVDPLDAVACEAHASPKAGDPP